MTPSRTGSALALALATFAALPFTTSAAIAQEMSHQTTMADARQGEPPPLPTDRNEYVEVRTLPEERLVEFVIGPVELEAGMEHLRLPVQMAAFPVDGWIHGFEIDVVDSTGEPMPLELLHHVNFIDPDKRELFSPIARRVMAAGRETSTERLPGLIGYPIADGDRMLIAAMFANPLEQDYPAVNLVVRFFYSTEADGLIQPRNIFPFYLDVMGPVGTKDFPVPPGRTVMSWEGQPAVEGRILAIGGHVHDYATRLALIDVTTGKTIWEIAPEGTPGGHVTGVPSDRFLWTLGKKIHADHVYRIEVEYDNPLDVAASDGGMGAIGGAVWVRKEVRWPEFDRTEVAYVEDLANTLTAPERMHGHGHGGMNATGDMHGMPADRAQPEATRDDAPPHDAHAH
jgi:hypothetical protein